jgi:hypothetical protein
VLLLPCVNFIYLCCCKDKLLICMLNKEVKYLILWHADFLKVVTPIIETTSYIFVI